MGTVRYTTIDGEIVAEMRSGVRRSYVSDPLDSTVAMLDNTQTQTDTLTYWPCGEERNRAGNTPTPFRFVGAAGYYSDRPSHTYVRTRYLDTTAGRWLTTDPLGVSDSDSTLYRYGASSPVTLHDPAGLQAGTGSWKCKTCKPCNILVPKQCAAAAAETKHACGLDECPQYCADCYDADDPCLDYRNDICKKVSQGGGTVTTPSGKIKCKCTWQKTGLYTRKFCCSCSGFKKCDRGTKP